MDIHIWVIGQTVTDYDELNDWVAHLGAEDYEADEGGVVGHAAKRCYNSFQPGMNRNVTKVREDWDRFFANILSQGHGSVLEHTTYNFAIEGLSRVATAELNRHRAGAAISEASMRYIRMDEMSYWLPLSIRDQSYASQRTRVIFADVFSFIKEKYAELEKLYGIDKMEDMSTKKKLTSMFRRIVPMGVATGGVWSFNLRALRHIIALRSTPAAEEEIAYIATEMGRLMIDREPKIFCDFEKKDGFWVPEYKKV